METSEQINEIAEALAKAQGKIGHAHKDSNNPFFKSKYADLSSVIDASRQALVENGISVIQSPEVGGEAVSVTTRIMHSSGQWIESTISAQPKDATPQGIGSAVTYLRRYGYSSMIGIAASDDDGQAASVDRVQRQPLRVAPESSPPESPPELSEKTMRKLHAVGSKFYEKRWNDKRKELVKHYTKGRYNSAHNLTENQAFDIIDKLSVKLEERETSPPQVTEQGTLGEDWNDPAPAPEGSGQRI